MAKMFYTLDETKAALGQSEDAIKQLTREGRLREFRDGPRLMFKADQVDALKSQLGGTISIADSGAPIGLADSGSATGTGVALTMADSIGSGLSSGLGGSMGSGLAGISGSGLGSGLTGGAGSGMMNLKEDTALAADLGLSGTVGGIPSPGRTGSGTSVGGASIGGGSMSGGSMGGGSMGGGSMGGGSMGSGTVSSRQGINVFGDDTHMPADPLAQTAVAGSGGSISDLNLEGIGSGSGLLDLTRESDETSLGAELLDEISPTSGRGRPMAPPDTGSMAGINLDAPRGGVVRGTTGVREVEAYDSWASAFGAMAFGTGLFLLLALFALINGVLGAKPDVIMWFEKQGNPFIVVLGMGALIAIIFGAFGKLLSKR